MSGEGDCCWRMGCLVAKTGQMAEEINSEFLQPSVRITPRIMTCPPGTYQALARLLQALCAIMHGYVTMKRTAASPQAGASSG